jgi:hypothetical protein
MAGDKQGAKACCQPLIPRELIEARLVERLRDHLLVEENIARIVEVLNEDIRTSDGRLQLQYEAVGAEIKETEATLRRYYLAFEDGVFTPSEVAPRPRALRQKLENAQASMAALQPEKGAEELRPADVLPHVADLLSLLGEADEEGSDQVVRSPPHGGPGSRHRRVLGANRQNRLPRRTVGGPVYRAFWWS